MKYIETRTASDVGELSRPSSQWQYDLTNGRNYTDQVKLLSPSSMLNDAYKQLEQ